MTEVAPAMPETVATTLMLVAFPFAADFYAALVKSIVDHLGAGYGTKWNARVSQLDQYAHSIVGPATKAAGRVLQRRTSCVTLRSGLARS